MASKTCSMCGARFDCGAGESARRCWCRALPPIMPLDFSEDCRCPPCLKTEIRSRLTAFVASVTPAQARAGVGRRWASDDAPVEGIDYELEGDRLVFTAWYLLKRGACCESGCRHCPYGFEAR
jgi:hypothetical protein